MKTQSTYEIYRGSTTVTYNDDQETRDKVFDKIIEWLKKYNVSSGEGLCQSDDPQIEAPILMADIVDDILECKSSDDDDDWEDD